MEVLHRECETDISFFHQRSSIWDASGHRIISDSFATSDRLKIFTVSSGIIEKIYAVFVFLISLDFLEKMKKIKIEERK